MLNYLTDWLLILLDDSIKMQLQSAVSHGMWNIITVCNKNTTVSDTHITRKRHLTTHS
jgi:hypothetical protein